MSEILELESLEAVLINKIEEPAILQLFNWLFYTSDGRPLQKNRLFQLTERNLARSNLDAVEAYEFAARRAGRRLLRARPDSDLVPYICVIWSRCLIDFIRSKKGRNNERGDRALTHQVELDWDCGRGRLAQYFARGLQPKAQAYSEGLIAAVFEAKQTKSGFLEWAHSTRGADVVSAVDDDVAVLENAWRALIIGGGSISHDCTERMGGNTQPLQNPTLLNLLAAEKPLLSQAILKTAERTVWRGLKGQFAARELNCSAANVSVQTKRFYERAAFASRVSGFEI